MAEQRVELGARVERRYDLSVLQREVWASQRLHPDVPLANMGHSHRLSASIDPERFRAAFARVVLACDALRTVVAEQNGRSVAHVLAVPPGETELIELEPNELDDWQRARVAVPIDATACMYDSVLIRHTSDDWTWWLNLHHVVTDAASQVLVFELLASAYDDLDAELDVTSFVDHLETSRPDKAHLDSAVHHSAPNSKRQPPLAPFGVRGPVTVASPSVPVELASTSDQSLAERAKQTFPSISPDLSMLALLAAALATTMHRLDGRSDFVIGIPVHHRRGRASRRVIGPLMELHPLAVAIEHGDTVDSLVTRTLEAVLHTMRTKPSDRAARDDFELVINVFRSGGHQFAGAPAEVRWLRAPCVEPAHSLRLHAFDFGAGTELELDVNESLVAGSSGDRLAENIASAIDSMLASPEQAISSLGVASHRDRAALEALVPAAPERRVGRPVHVEIAERLRREPSWVVAHDRVESVTASEFDERIGRAVAWLRSEGVVARDRVGLRMGRSIDVLVAVHAILRCGAAFVMLDPADPETRHQALSDDADLRLIVDHLDDAATHAPDPHVESSHLDDIAYVLYTSGSTGLPKGVPISHGGLDDYLEFAVEAYCDPTVAPVVALHSKLIFDLTITSLFLSFLGGGSVVVFDGDPIVALGRIATDDRINFVKATPSQLEIFARMVDAPRPIRTVVVGGEAFRRPVAVATALSCQPGVRIFNEYGPTEAVVGCMIHEWSPSEDHEVDVPIGAAAPGCELTVLDADGNPVPAGAWGELYVRRLGMAADYLNRPELTVERFVTLEHLDLVPGAFGGAERGPWYRTGDRVRQQRPGVLVYGGRLDDQMKVNGVRLEPAEVEAALVRHPNVANALVRLWTPADRASSQRCVRCGLGTDVPGIDIDGAGVCSACRSFDAVAPQTEAWFRDEVDLELERASARLRSEGDYDCLHLLSGGKDSSYALYQLVERGWRVHALTLDNGFISDGAKENIQHSIDTLGITHEFVTTDAMNEIFRDSLDRYSNVCQGCYKTIYTMAVARADELGIPVIVTGLSRGQFFETRLIPAQFEQGRFDPDAIDATVLEARKVYHQVPDAVTELLPEQRVFDDEAIFDRIRFVDFYRYVDVELDEVYRYLDENAPWVRPKDTGRSTNCLINVAGIQVHHAERGYHNYAEPYAWDVRLGHKTRNEALAELDDRLAGGVDDPEVVPMLAEVGYRPKRVEILTAWYQTVDGADLDADELRRHVRGLVADSAVPSAFVRIDEMPLAASAKADPAALPAPTRIHRQSDAVVLPGTAVEHALAEVWADVLHVEGVGVADDFFDLGGDSLAALEVVATIADTMNVSLDDAAVFHARTIRQLAALIEADPLGAAARSDAEIPELDTHLPAPLSAGEEAMLFDYRRDPSDTRYNVTRWYRLPADVDLDLLDAAIRTVAMQHGPLHRTFDAARSELDARAAVSFERLDRCTTDEFRAFAMQQAAAVFDLDAGPLVRVHVASVNDAGTASDDGIALLIGMHHICIDAGTFDVFWSQVAAAYEGSPPSMSPSVDYARHAAWQRTEVHPLHRDFWLAERRRASDIGVPVALGLAAPSTPEADGYLSKQLELDTSTLRSGPARTPFVSALAAAAVAIDRHSLAASDGARSVEIGITASAKDHPATGPMVGYFLNTLPLRIDLSSGRRTQQLIDDVGALVAGAVEHRTYPFASIVRDARSEGLIEPDVSVMLAYERLAPASLGGRQIDHEILASGTAVSDVTLFVQERDERLSIGIEYSGQAVSSSDAQRMLDVFGDVLSELATGTDVPVAELAAGMAVSDLVGEPLDALPDGPERSTVLHAIVEQAVQAPDAVAALDATGRSITYVDLLASALDTADALIADVDGSMRDRLVGVCMHRGVDMVVGFLAAQLCGGAYVPLDPTSPDDRLDTIAGSVDLAAVLVDHATDGRVTAPTTARIAPVTDSSDHMSVVQRARIALERVDRDAGAYVIFTSGSTGTPRGVAVSHRNLAASTFARPQMYDNDPERFLLTSSIGFDSSIVGLFWPLVTGGAVVIPTDDDVQDVDRLAVLIEQSDVTHLLMVPSLYRALLARGGAQMDSLRVAIVAGEACSTDVVDLHRNTLGSAALFNEYGPTEASVWSSVHRLDTDRSDAVSIGAPICGVTLRVADGAGRAVPIGVAGELFVSGPTVTAGYLDDADATADRFVSADGRRWYRTGDLVRAVERDGDTVLDFIGRVDDQLNVGGVRLEPGEVEAALLELEGISDAVVVAADDRGRSRLVAHVVIRDRALHDVERIRQDLGSLLPLSHVPSRFIVHDRLPRTSHGKLDRAAAAALPLGSDREVEETDAPTGGLSPLVDEIVAIWRGALGRTDITSTTDYFEAGGDSLAAVEIVAAIEDTVDRRLTIGLLLDGRTPAGMAALIDPDARRVLGGDAAAGSDGVRLITMQAGASDGPVVVLTPAWDDVFGYRALVDALPDDIRVLAVSAADVAPEKVVSTIDALGAQCERVLLGSSSNDVERPITLLGWSTGGVLAYELADRLRLDGCDVRHVAMVDTFFPGAEQHLWSNRWWKYKTLATPSALADEVSTFARRRLRTAAKVVGTKLMKLSGAEVVEGPKRTSVGGVPVEAFSYQPEAGRVPVIMYAATTTNPDRTHHLWTDVADVTVVPVEGRHRGFDSIMSAERVNQITDDLLQRLR